ncbi:sulfur oxidation c-type cytochrome SoxX [Thiomicrorhabdus aquaedulcis]|uniref:sulfur oxidation c-type cytochrome SoxX n=1 Tax=Thiomicrorhabdus aquaedulcis TaxID=2211106 RepID=UPI000FDA863A|nr:sulfur oxidation c-type cytochrome SoxX [Thiomicrorhabdus aquaedulcis]
MFNSKMKQLMSALVLSTAVISVPFAAHAQEPAKPAAAAAKPAAKPMDGKQLTIANSKGNCLACHMVADGAQPGNIGPAIVAMKLRYPDKQKLYDKIWAQSSVPNSMMPAFGQHGILTDDEINKIVDYIYTL